jgi:hypothetical protein
VTIGAPGQPEHYRVAFGPATQTSSGRVFSALFVEARPVANVPSLQEAPGDLDGIIRVGITDGSMAWNGGPLAGTPANSEFAASSRPAAKPLALSDAISHAGVDLEPKLASNECAEGAHGVIRDHA